jgi:hypothetical protein
VVNDGKTGFPRDNAHSVYEHLGPALELNRSTRTREKNVRRLQR